MPELRYKGNNSGMRAGTLDWHPEPYRKVQNPPLPWLRQVTVNLYPADVQARVNKLVPKGLLYRFVH
jgi:hypothetical protein